MTPVRCPDLDTAKRMMDLIEEVKDGHDSIGGIISCHVVNAPIGWGEPVFDRLVLEMFFLPPSLCLSLFLSFVLF